MAHPETALQAERPASFLKDLISWVGEYSKLKKFLSTRRSIRAGTALFDETAEDLKKNDLMGPITFNVYQSTLSAIPALILAYILGILDPHEPAATVIPNGADQFTKLWLAEIYKIGPGIGHVFQPFIVPLLLLLLAWGSARGSLQKRDISPKSLTRCRNAFLYYDGVYGLFPQAFMAFAISLVTITVQSNWPDPIGIVSLSIAGLIAAIGLIWALYLTWSKFPKLLFALNGYSLQKPKWWQIRWKNKPPNAAPWNRYAAHVYIVGGAGTWLLLLVIFLLEVLCIRYVAWLRVSLRLWFQHHA